jgi:exopolysaccharide biosynthesis protein
MKYAYSLINGPSTTIGPNPDPNWPDLASSITGGGRKKVRWKMETAIGGGPTLMQSGKIAITNVEERMFVNGENDRHPRTAMGYTKEGKLIIMAIEGRRPGIAEGATLLQEAALFKDLGCWEALNLDGGGSSCLLINGKETIKPSDKEGQRPIPAVFQVFSVK